jgi:LacI family transcriptional regulator
VAVPGITGFSFEQPEIPISSVQERVDGFAQGVKSSKAAGIWVYSEEKQKVAESAVEKLLDSPKPPTVIFTSNNDMLLAVLKIAGDRGLSIGKDLSVVSFDDSPWAAAMMPGITVIARPVEDLGHIAVTELVEAIEGNTKAKEIVLPASLIKRGSVAKLTKSN